MWCVCLTIYKLSESHIRCFFIICLSELEIIYGTIWVLLMLITVANFGGFKHFGSRHRDKMIMLTSNLFILETFKVYIKTRTHFCGLLLFCRMATHAVTAHTSLSLRFNIFRVLKRLTSVGRRHSFLMNLNVNVKYALYAFFILVNWFE